MANKRYLTSRLLGHVFGDGSIHKSKKYFIYTNATPELQSEVNETVVSLLGEVPFSIGTSIAGTPRYQYSNVVGKFLIEKGAPLGSKIMQRTSVPKWILDDNEKTQAIFLGALFDDDGYFRDSVNCRQIVLKTAKASYLEDSLRDYLTQIIEMLDNFRISTSDIKSDQLKTRKDGCEIISLRFWITGKDNLMKFRERIQLSHPSKKVKFDDLFLAPVR